VAGRRRRTAARTPRRPDVGPDGGAEALRTLLGLKSEFLSRVSHELRTPLTYILGYAELLRDRALSPQEVREHADEIHEQASHLAGLVDALIDASQTGRSPARLARTRINLLTAVRAAWESVSDRGAHRLETDADDELLVFADETKLRRVLRTLLDNAVRYSPGPNTVSVRAAPSEGGVAIAVIDRGIGFAPVEAERLFEPLFRAGGDHVHYHRGLGLGLTRARAIAVAHGGTLTGRSDGPGTGARFELWLPLEAPPGARSSDEGPG
jgi:two-component system, sensor histidine kinase